MSWWPTALERRIALRYLRGQRGTRSASLQTLVAIGGIAVGVMALIVVLGVMNGLRNDLRERILIASPHLRVIPFGDNLVLRDWRPVLDEIRRQPDVVAAAPEVISQTLVVNHDGYPEAAKVAGLEPGVGTRDVTGLDSAITEGGLVADDALPDSVDAGVLLGDRLARRLNVYVGDRVKIYSPMSLRRSRMSGTMTPVEWVVEVTGIFETGLYVYDNEFLVMSRQDAQRFAGLGDNVSVLAVRVKDPARVADVAARLDSLLGGYRIETWQQANSQLFGALELEKLAMGLVIFFIMIVAAFNIVGTLSMVVAFKTREIGILEAMGVEPRGIGRIFLAQGAIVGLTGTSIGLVLGLVVATVVDRTGLVRIDPSIYFIDHLPVHVEPFDVAIVVLAAIALAVVATIHPARQAAALDPVEAVRAE
jgi:lipoprotein-releasing system permease protein